MRPKAIAWVAPFSTALCIAAYFVVFIRPSLADGGTRSVWSDYDYQSYFLPRFVEGSKWLLRGKLPLWNAYEFNGIPFLATGQPAVFYPPKILLYGLLEPIAAHWTFLVIHYVLFGGAFLLFLRNRGLVGVPAFVGTAIWGFSVPLLVSNYHPNRIASLVWMPLAFVLADRFAAGSWRALAWLSVVVLLLLTAGYPVLAIHVGVLLAIHAVACFRAREWNVPPWKALPLLGAAFVVGGVAAAAQLLPLSELASIAKRTEMANLSSAAELPHWNHPLFAMAPGLLVFALIGAPLARARPAVFSWALCWVLASGGWKLVRALPGFSLTRFPFTWAFFLPFFAGWSAAVGLDALLERKLSPRATRVALAALIVASGGLAAGYAAAFVEGEHFLPAFPYLALFRYNTGGALAASLGVASCLGLVALSVAGLRGHWPRLPWLAAVLAATFAHLAAAPFASVPAPFSRPSRTGVVEQLYAHSNRVEGRVLSLHDLRYGYEITDGLPSPLGVESSFLPIRYEKIVERLNVTIPFQLVDWRAVAGAAGLLDAMDVELVVVPDEAVKAFFARGYAPVRHVGHESLLKSGRRMGHAWVDYAVHRVASANEALDYVLGGNFDPRREVVVEDALRHDFPATTDELATPAFARPTTDPNHTEFDVELDKPGVFVVSESAYPGFRATVDGAPVDWKTADFVLRAVELEPGHHVVAFDYRPASVRRGLWVSAFGLAAIAALLFIAWRRPPRAPVRTQL